MSPGALIGDASGPVHVFYATQTGNAEEIARRIASDLREACGNPALSLKDYASSSVFAAGGDHSSPPAVAVFVVATTGDGDVPDVIRPFMRFMRKAVKDKALEGRMRYAVLGLGDTNYESFCGAAKKIDQQLAKAGGKSFYARGLADDGTGMEEVIEPWIEGLSAAVAAVLKEIGLSGGIEGLKGASTSPATVMSAVVEAAVEEELIAGFKESDLPSALLPGLSAEKYAGDVAKMESTSPHFDFSQTIRAPVVGAKRLTDCADRCVYHLEVEGGDSLVYAPGDAFGCLVENTAADVERAVKTIRDEDSAADDAVVWQVRDKTGMRSVLATGSARELLTERVELRAAPKKTLLRALSVYCVTEDDCKTLLTLAAKPKAAARKPDLSYGTHVVDAGLGVLDVIDTYAPSCRPPLSLLLDQVAPLALRYYSAASAPEIDGTHLHFAFSVVKDGLATTALAKRAKAFLGGVNSVDIPQVLIVPRASDATSVFRPPQDLTTPYIMVGPGTGVAPFRGFLRKRDALLKGASVDGEEAKGDALLFYGCRREAEDFLYAEELREFESSSTLSVLDVAFSRDGPAKVYVQDRLEERAESVAEVLASGGSFFVCGDGGGMATSVDAVLHRIVTSHICNGDAVAGKAYVKNMTSEHRYVRDIWYFGSVEL